MKQVTLTPSRGEDQVCTLEMIQHAIQAGTKKNNRTDISVDLTHKQLTCVPKPKMPNYRIKFVYLNHNEIHGTIDLNPLIRAWFRIHSLQITWNKIDSIKDMVPVQPSPMYTTLACQTSFLRELNLSMNRLTTLPEDMPRSLEKINVSNNHIERLPHSFSKLSNLTHLWLDRNNLHVSKCKTIVTLMHSKLKVLSMSGNPLFGIPLPHSGTPDLDIEELYFNDCRIDYIPDSLYNCCRNIKILSMSRNALKTVGHCIFKLKRLHTLNTSHCSQLRHLSPSLGKLDSLRRVNVEFCTAMMKLPRLKNVMNIRFIGLKGTPIKKLPITWGENQRLRVSFRESTAMLNHLYKIFKSLNHGSPLFRICVCNYVCDYIEL